MSMGNFSLSLKYSSLKPGTRFYLHGGAGLAYAFSRNNTVDRYQKIDSIESRETFDWSNEAMSKVYLEVLAGIGATFDLSEQYPLFVEVRIDQLFANDPPTPGITRVGVVAGVGF